MPDTGHMAAAHTPTSIEETGDGLRITMPIPRVGCVSAFLSAWIVGWVAGEVSALRALFSIGGSAIPVAAFLLLWLAGWTLGGVFAAWALLMSLDGREIVTIENGVIRRRAEAFFLGLSWRYPLVKCRNLRPTGDSDGTNTFVSFDYAAAKGEQTVRFGSGLTESSAEEIAERVWAAFPELMPEHERRRREQDALQAGRVPDPPAEAVAETPAGR